MYTYFSNRLGFVVSELPPDDMDRQDRQKEATLGDFATASSPARDLEIAVFRRSLGAGEGHLAAALAWYLDEAGFGPGGNGAGEF